MAGPVRLSALDYGDPAGPSGQASPPMVLLHGMSDLAWSMDSVAQAFCGRCRVVSVDLRGHGCSEHPGAYSTLHLAADLKGVIDTLGLAAPVLVAHSLGGHAAAHYAALYPDVPRALVLVEGVGPPARLAADTPEARAALARAHLELLGAPLAHKPLRDLDAAVARLAEAHPKLAAARARRLAEEGTVAGPDGGLVWRFDPRSRDWIASVDHGPEEQERWRQVRCPVLVVNGAQAWERWWNARLSLAAQAVGRVRYTPEEQHERLSAFGDLEHLELDDAGHMVQFDQPERLNEVIADFLARRVQV